MWHSDFRRVEFNPDTVIVNNHMISEIEKELQDNPYDMKSMVFLLYDTPISAWQHLMALERISKTNDVSTYPNILHEWFRQAEHTPLWKHEFIEALLLCQLNSAVRKLGLHVSAARNYYQIDNLQTRMYINPVKKALYKLCENMNADDLVSLKNALFASDIDASGYDSCELILLKLMCDKFITINQYQVQLGKLLKIIETLPGLENCVQEFRILQQLNEVLEPNVPFAASTPFSTKLDESNLDNDIHNSYLYYKDFKEVFDMVGALCREENSNINSLKSDKTEKEYDTFEIKSHKRVGVCVILNQMNFQPSLNCIENNQTNSLSTRKGSDKDQTVIETTMKALNFSVYSAKNLFHKEIFYYLTDILKTKVVKDDSLFMLCILSHGGKGYIYASDCVKVSVDDIQNLLCSDVAKSLCDKPIILTIQACQDDESPPYEPVVDYRNNYVSENRNVLRYWATSPGLKAYRHVNHGSIFIQSLCYFILKYANTEHICDIFTKVNQYVQNKCGKLQVPIIETNLTKKLYLKNIKNIERHSNAGKPM